MQENRKYRVFTEEFKTHAVNRVKSGDKLSQVAKDLDIAVPTLCRWCKTAPQVKAQANTNSEAELHAEIMRLKRDVARVTEERDLLKKSIALFVRTGS